MMRSLYSGISGMSNFQTKMDVIGNNIANVNTVAFKGSRVNFAETLSQTLAGEKPGVDGQGGVNRVQVGLGMRTLSIDTNFNQGSLENTGVITDMAIQGNGFFTVTDGQSNYYTRAGTFSVDASGNLVMGGKGYLVTGYLSNENGELDRTSTQGIQIPMGRRTAASATSEVMLYGNLDMNMTESEATLKDAGLTGITSVNGTAEDGVGGQHEIRITGQPPTQSVGAGATQGMLLTDTLAAHGVSDTAGFSVVVDGTQTIEITGLTASSTISDLINAINRQVAGVTAQLDANGAIQITRDFYGNGAEYNVSLVDGAGGSDIVANLLNNAGTFTVNSGTVSTLVAVDVFTPNGSNDTSEHALALTFDDQTGLATGLSNLGGGGVSINSPGGLNTGTAIIETEDTTHSTSIFVYDSQGNTHNLTVNLTRSETNGMWRWSVEVPDPATIVEGGSGTVSFRADGSLENFTYANNATSLTLNPGNGAENMTMKFNAGTFGELDGVTQASGSTSLMANDQNGYGMGTLEDIYVDNNGKIFGNYSNGVTEVLAQVLLASFTNPQGLEHIGDNLYRQTTNSGPARVNEAEQVGSKINSGYLEQSNVDLTKEFTDMIIMQRAFTAASKVIQNADQILQIITNLKMR